jgi:hypothetical protein
LAALFYAPLLLGLRTFPDGDFTHHFLPFSLFQQQAVGSGQLPLWNPYTYAGHPFLADTQAAVFYPVSNFVLALTWPWTSPGARLYFLQVEAILHIALAGFFVYLLVRDLTSSRPAGFIAGCCFAFSGYLTGYPPLQLAILRTAIWLPLLLWLLHRALTEPRGWRWWLGAALATATAIFAGHPQTWLYLGYTAGAFILWHFAARIWRRRTTSHPPQPTPLQSLPGLILFVVLALALSAAQLLPSLEFAQASVRAEVDYAFVSGGFPLQDTWQILLPGVLTQFSPLYISVVGLGLVILGIGNWLFGSSSHAPPPPPTPYTLHPTPYTLLPFFTLLTLIALLLSYGGNAFLYPIFYGIAPGWDLFRGQERAALMVALGLSVLAGYGAAAIPTMALRLRRWWALFFMLLVAGGVYGFGLFWQLPGRTAIGQGRYLVVAFITLTLAAALTVLLRLPEWSSRRTFFVAALLLINLVWANAATNLTPFGPERKVLLPPEVMGLAEAVGARATVNLGLPSRVYNEFRVYENYGLRTRIEDVWGSSPLRLARYTLLFDNFPLDRMWRLTGVEHVLTWRRELFEPSTLLGEYPQTADTTYLHRLDEPNPRVWLVGRVEPATDAEATRLLGDHTFDLERMALVPPDLLTTAHGDGSVGAYSVQLARPAHNRLAVTVNSEQGGLLVISENWLPGWRVLNAECGVGSREREVGSGECSSIRSPFSGLPILVAQRVNLTLVGVVAPPGEVRFELVYWPESVRLGLWISGGALALMFAALAGRWWWKGRRR